MKFLSALVETDSIHRLHKKVHLFYYNVAISLHFPDRKRLNHPRQLQFHLNCSPLLRWRQLGASGPTLNRLPRRQAQASLGQRDQQKIRKRTPTEKRTLFLRNWTRWIQGLHLNPRLQLNRGLIKRRTLGTSRHGVWDYPSSFLPGPIHRLLTNHHGPPSKYSGRGRAS